MRILACRNFRISYPLAHFETFSAVPAPGFSRTVDQFLRRSLAQVRAPAGADHDVRVTGVALSAAPPRATAQVGHVVGDRMRLHRAEIFSYVHVQSHAIPLYPEGLD
jgi:hypothetical protein